MRDGVAVYVSAAIDTSGWQLPEGVVLTVVDDAAGLAAALREGEGEGDGAVIVVSDGCQASQLAGLAGHASTRPVIEVRLASWDGVTPSRFTAACRGIVSGFGPGGVAAAARLLLAEGAAG